MKQVLTRLYDTKEKVYFERYLTKREFENLPFRYCLPYEVDKRTGGREQMKSMILKRRIPGVMIEWELVQGCQE